MESIDYLSDREIFILQNHPTMTYKAIGDKFGISAERVRQIKAYAERKVRKQKNKEYNAKRALEPVTITIERRELQLILRALNAFYKSILAKEYDQRRRNDTDDPDRNFLEKLISQFQIILKE